MTCTDVISGTYSAGARAGGWTSGDAVLPPGRIAVTVLAVLRHDQGLADMAGGNNVSESTVRRWRDELITLLAAQAPRLVRALKKVAKHGGEVVLIDGTLVPTRRRTGKADRRNYVGKHHHHGLHLLALREGKTA
ncbi:hypothetical protein [Streptomyces milbemycinicus]|uniref:hypothetical protein n=1 Tax=Streptomyces milbemycinicus TaxID=476552 RepID=UPI0033DBFDBE